MVNLFFNASSQPPKKDFNRKTWTLIVKYFLTLSIAIASNFALGQGNSLLMIDRSTQLLLDQVGHGDFVQCLIKPDGKFLQGYVKEINDSSIILKNPAGRKHTIPINTLSNMRKLSKSKLYLIPLLGVLISGVGVVTWNTGALDYAWSSRVAAVGVLIVGIGNLTRGKKYSIKKLRTMHRVDDNIVLKVVTAVKLK